MKKEIRSQLLALLTLITLLTSAVFATPAFADGGTPTTNPTTPTGSGSTTIDVSQLPAGTTVIVTDGQGHRVPLGTQKAAQIEASGDPVWCPASLAAPTPGSGGCSPSFTSFTNAVAGLIPWLTSNQPAMDGIIWIEGSGIAGGYDSSLESGAVIFNGSTLNTMSGFRLTLRGGWVGCAASPCAGTIDTTHPSLFTVPLQVVNWNNDVTLSDIEASNTATDGIRISTKTNVALTDVNAHNNTGGWGVNIDNTAGTGAVNIVSSEFDDNKNGGLYVRSNGLITLSSVEASGNSAGYGVQLDNGGAATAVNVTLTGNNAFDQNFKDGLNVNTKGAVAASNLEASGNGSNGVTLTQSFLATGSIALTGTNVFSGNALYGLQITGYGAVTASGLIAYGNKSDGVNIDNHGALTAQPVTLNGSNQFKFNAGNGLYIDSLGAVKLNNVTADSNAQNGVQLNNSISATVKSTVTLTGANLFIGNQLDGLNINSNGLVTLNSLTAIGNGSSAGNNGVTVTNNNSGTAAGVTLTGTNYFSNNTGSGLYIRSYGAIAAAALTSNDNQSNGVDLDNCIYNTTACTGAGGVTLTLNNAFNNNVGIGLKIVSNGAIATNNLSAAGNVGSAGVLLDNHQSTAAPAVTLNGTNFFTGNAGDGLDVNSKGAITAYNLKAGGNGTGASGNGASLNNTYGTGGTVSVLGSNTFNGNASEGLDVQSKGAVTLSSVTANSNMNSHGVRVNNTFTSTSSPQNVTVNGVNVFNNNVKGEGLWIQSYGAVTISNVSASGNGTSAAGHGVFVQNNGGLSSQARPVTVNGVSNMFSGNYASGLAIQSYGAISVSNVTANGPLQGEGLILDNTFSTTSSGVTLTNVSASNNSGTGIDVRSDGVITASGLSAVGNGNYGASLNNSTASTARNVSLSGTNVFSQNTNTGLYVQTLGAVTAAGVQSNLNHNQGVNVSAGNSTNASAVTFTGLNVFIGNYADGLYVTAFGAIKTGGLNAISNGINDTNGYGVYLDNHNSTLPQIVSVLGVSNIFNGNYSGGLYVYSMGAISANNLTAIGNNSTSLADGVYLKNDDIGASGGVTLTGYNVFNGNGFNGLEINSRGAITLNNVTANQNGYEGAYLKNQLSTTAGISIYGSNSFSLNGTNGLDVNTNGTATLNKIYADGNTTGSGAVITSAAAALTCGSFTNNGQYGLYMLSATGTSAYMLIGLTFSGNAVGDQFKGPGVTVTPTLSCPLP